MKKVFDSIPGMVLFFIVLFVDTSVSNISYAYAVDPLGQPYILYTDNKGLALSYPEKDLEAKKVPVVNLFLNQPGCYLACHTHNPQQGAYVSSAQTYTTGLIRVEGQYENTYCVPTDLNTPDVRNDENFRALCSKAFMCIGNSCWATANTGGWFGLK